MKKLYFVTNGAGDMFVTYDEETKIAMVLDDSNDMETPIADIDIHDVEDDSSWEMYEDVDDIDEFLNADHCDTVIHDVIDFQ